MLKVLQMSLVRRFALLAMMMTGLAGFAINDLTAASNKTVLPCCSICDVEDPPIVCRHGCSPSC